MGEGRGGGSDPALAGLTLDSRKVGPGFLFAALAGNRQDGAAFVAEAVKRGAVAILAAPDADLAPLDPSVVVIRDANPRRRVALMAAAFAGTQPATIAAVTGTNGKSSTVHFVRHIWASLGLKAASVGTLGIFSPGLTREARPDHARSGAAPCRIWRSWRARASRISPSRRRATASTSIGSTVFACRPPAFTNLTHEHLDYHASMETYFAAKARLFDSLLPEGGTAVINADSDRAQALMAICARRGVRCWTYGAKGREFRLLKERGDVGRPASGGRDAGRAARHRAAAGRRLPGLQRAGRPRRSPWRPAAMSARSVEALGSVTGAPGRLQLVARHRTGAQRLCRLCPQARGAGDRARDPAAVRHAASWSWCSAAAAIAIAPSGR